MKIFTAGDALPALVVSAAMVVWSGAASAAIQTTSATIAATSGSGNYTQAINGLNQFDASLGTLTDITLSLAIDEYTISLSLAGFEDPGTGAVFESARLSGQFSIDAALPGGGGLLFASTVFGEDIFDEFAVAEVGGSAVPAVAENATARLVDDNLLSSFIGTGEVSILSLSLLAFGNPELVTLDDQTFAYGDPSIDSFIFGPSTVTVTYAYTPAPIPLPAAAWFFGSALLGLGACRRRRLCN